MNDLKKDIKFINSKYEQMRNNVEILSKDRLQTRKRRLVIRKFTAERDRYQSILCHLVEFRTHKQHEKYRKEEAK
jgi:hypothetical protein